MRTTWPRRNGRSTSRPREPLGLRRHGEQRIVCEQCGECFGIAAFPGVDEALKQRRVGAREPRRRALDARGSTLFRARWSKEFTETRLVSSSSAASSGLPFEDVDQAAVRHVAWATELWSAVMNARPMLSRSGTRSSGRWLASSSTSSSASGAGSIQSRSSVAARVGPTRSTTERPAAASTRRRRAFSRWSRQALVAILYSQGRIVSGLASSCRCQARSSVSCTISSASCSEPSMR